MARNKIARSGAFRSGTFRAFRRVPRAFPARSERCAIAQSDTFRAFRASISADAERVCAGRVTEPGTWLPGEGGGPVIAGWSSR
jgi:hypothetical protein